MPAFPLDDCNLHAEVAGSGSPVMLIHGATGDSTDYRSPVAPALGACHTVISYDQQGVGRSGTASVIEVTDARAEPIEQAEARFGEALAEPPRWNHE